MKVTVSLAVALALAVLGDGCGDSSSSQGSDGGARDGGNWTGDASPLSDASAMGDAAAADSSVGRDASSDAAPQPSDGSTQTPDASGDAGNPDCVFTVGTCWSGPGVDRGCTQDNGTLGTCPTANRQGSCAFDLGRNRVTAYYYKMSDGSPYQDINGQTADIACMQLDKGVYTAL